MINSTILELELLDRLNNKKFDEVTLYKLRDLFYSLHDSELYGFVSGEINGFNENDKLPKYRIQNNFIINNGHLLENHYDSNNPNEELNILLFGSLKKLSKIKSDYVKFTDVVFYDKNCKIINNNEDLKIKHVKINFESFEINAINYYLEMIKYIISERLIRQ